MPRTYTSADIPRSDDFSFRDPIPIHTEVSMALSAWVLLESVLLDLLRSLVHANIHSRMAITSARFDLANVRDMILWSIRRGTVVGTVPPDLPDYLDEVSRFSERRYELIHGCVSRYNNGRDSGYFLRPLDNIGRYVLIDNPEYRWTVTELRLLKGHFDRLRAECQEIIRRHELTIPPGA